LVVGILFQARNFKGYKMEISDENVVYWGHTWARV